MKFLVHYEQKGEGCDYTIGCGHRIVILESNTIEDARQKVIGAIKENYTGERELESATIYPFTQTIVINPLEVYAELRLEQEDLKRKKQEQEELLLLEKLQKKYNKEV